MRPANHSRMTYRVRRWSGCCASTRPSRPGAYPERDEAGARSWRSAPSPFTGTSSSCATGCCCRSSMISRARGYYYTEEVAAFPTVQITEGELFALLVAEKALQQYRGTSFEKPLAKRDPKDGAVAAGHDLPQPWRTFEQTISFRTRAEPILDLDVFDALAKATADRTATGAFLSQTGPAANRRHASWIPITWPTSTASGSSSRTIICAKTSAPSFPPASKLVRATGKTFNRPQKFSLERRLARQLRRTLRARALSRW